MNKLRRWLLKRKLLHYFKEEYPLSQSYPAMLNHLDIRDTDEVADAFRQLFMNLDIRVADLTTRKGPYPECIYCPPIRVFGRDWLM